MDGLRDWQNWQEGDVARAIDDYWTSAPNEIAFRKTLAMHIKETLAPGDVLEVGCGSGLIYGALKETGALREHPYQGGDITPKMLQLARKRHLGVTFRRLDIYHLSDEHADNVLCIQVLQHLPDYRAPLQQLIAAARRMLYVVCWFGERDETIKGRDDGFGGGRYFYTNVYALKAFVDFAAAQPGVRSVETHDFGALSQAVIVHMEG